MAAVSPGIYVREFDFSDYVATLGSTTLAVIGGATKGPLDTPTLVLSEGDLIRNFGAPLTTDYGLQSAIQFLKRGTRCLYTRVADPTASTGVQTATAVVYGGILSTGTVELTGAPVDTDKFTLLIGDPVIRITNNTATSSITMSTVGSSIGLANGTPRATLRLRANPSATGGETLTVSDGTTSITLTFTAGANSATNVQVGGTAALTAANVMTSLALTALNSTCTFLSIPAATGIAFEFDNTGAPATAGAFGVTIGATNAATMANALASVNANAIFGDIAFTAVDISAATPKIRILASTAGVTFNQTITKTGTNVIVTGMTGGTAFSTPLALGTNLVTFSAASPGSWANGIQIVVSEYRDPAVASTTQTSRRTVSVYASPEPGSSLALVETYADVSLDSTSARFLQDMLLSGIQGEVSASEYIRADVSPAGSTSTVPYGVMDAGTYTMGRVDLGYTTGQDGITGLRSYSSNLGAPYIGTVNGQAATGLQALRNAETTEFNILCIPGVSHKLIIAAMADVASFRGDCLYLVDPPLGLSVQQVVDWSNGLRATVDSTAPATALDDNRGALFWPWIEISDPYTKKTFWAPPSGQVAGAMARSDDVNGPWWAVAGSIRGKVLGNKIEYSPSRTERDLLVGGTNRVNPIINRSSSGLTVYGNRTLQRRNSALNSLHARRMLLYAEKTIATATQFLEFNPNDSQTWKQFTLLANTELDRIKAGRGLETFKVICDATTNTANLRQNKTMRAKLMIVPVEANEITLLDFAVLATGTVTFNENF